MDVLIIPSTWLENPLRIQEGSARGGLEHRSIAELVDDGRNGFVVVEVDYAEEP
jgi:hypothetical protein